MQTIRAKGIKLVAISDIKFNPNNRNLHPDDQIKQLAEIIKCQGFRRPVTISNQSGFLVCGEGRVHAAKLVGMTHIPAMFQDYDNPELEYADGIADNALDKQAKLDFQAINNDLQELSPSFKIEWLGIKGFGLDPDERTIELQENTRTKKECICPACGLVFEEV